MHFNEEGQGLTNVMGLNIPHNEIVMPSNLGSNCGHTPFGDTLSSNIHEESVSPQIEPRFAGIFKHT